MTVLTASIKTRLPHTSLGRAGVERRPPVCLQDPHIIGQIVVFLGPVKAAQLELTCQQWREAINEDFLWELWTDDEFGPPFFAPQMGAWKAHYVSNWTAPRQPILDYIRRCRSWRAVRKVPAMAEVEAALAQFPQLRPKVMQSREEAEVRLHVQSQGGLFTRLSLGLCFGTYILSLLGLGGIPHILPRQPLGPLAQILPQFWPVWAVLGAASAGRLWWRLRLPFAPAQPEEPPLTRTVARLYFVDAIVRETLDEVRGHYLYLLPLEAALVLGPYLLALVCFLVATFFAFSRPHNPGWVDRTVPVVGYSLALLQLWARNRWYGWVVRHTLCPLLTAVIFRSFRDTVCSASPVFVTALSFSSLFTALWIPRPETGPMGRLTRFHRLIVRWASLLATLQHGLAAGLALRAAFAVEYTALHLVLRAAL